VAGLAGEARAIARTGKGPALAAAHKEAASLFAAARQHWTEAERLLAARSGASRPAAKVLVDVRQRAAELAGPAVFLAEARRLTDEGRPDLAWARLRHGQERGRDAVLWYARAEAGARAP